MSPREIKKAVKHLEGQERISEVLKKIKKPVFENNRDPFESLARSIVYQQLSGASANAIWNRFVGITKSGISPKKVFSMDEEKMRLVGLSRVKVSYLKDLSKKFLDGTIEPKNFGKMTDEEIREHLTAVKGVGRWTADMFLMFTLHRLDVLPVGDLGIQKGFKKLFNMKLLPDAKKMEKIAKNWSPYRTIACMYLWRFVDEKESGW